MKRLFFLTLACILTLQTPVYADVAGPYLPGIFQEAKEKGYVDLETKPLTLVLHENSRTVESFVAVGTNFVPLRETAAFFGKTTVYNSQNKTIRLLDEIPVNVPASEITAESKRFYQSNIPIFYKNSMVNNQALHPLLPYSYTCDGVTYVPLKTLAGSFDYMYTIDYGTNSILLQQPVGLVTPVKTIYNAYGADGYDERKELWQKLQTIQDGKQLYGNAYLQPYLDEIRLIEDYTYNEPHHVTRYKWDYSEHELVLYNGKPYIYYTTHTIEWQDCTGPAMVTLYQLNLPEADS